MNVRNEEGVTMQCSRRNDDELAGQMMELLYGEADAEARGAVEAHLAVCAACRDEMAALRQELQATDGIRVTVKTVVFLTCCGIH